jgi:23S rRNA pseudouridine2605 synthase
MRERLQKIIARAGLASRRAAEELITGGRVRVNGRVATELGEKADSRVDKIEVDGKRVIYEPPIYIVLHKPRNVVSTLSDPEGRPTVAELLRGVGTRVHPVGRLDFATSGVLLATNDGELTQGLLHPKRAVPKTYVVKVQGKMSEDDIETWCRGVQLEDGLTLPANAKMLRYEGDKTWFEITIREGRNQQIRRMGDATGFRVMRLVRTSFAGITHEGLPPGAWRPLDVKELTLLRDTFGVPKRVKAAAQIPAPDARRPAPPRPPRPARPARRTTAETAGNTHEPGARGAKRGGHDEQPSRAANGAPRGKRAAASKKPARPRVRSARSGRS